MTRANDAPAERAHDSSDERLLEGVRVLDFTRFVAGPYCTMMLAELGADVIKVENPNGGDGTRKWAADQANTRGPDNPYFMSVNRSKRSLVIDLTSAEGKRLIDQLIAECDVVIHNFRRDSAERLGLSFEDVRRVNPRIVYCDISAYGYKGPLRDKRGVDLIMQAELGIMRMIGDEGYPPLKVPFPIVDLVTANNAAIGIVSALLRRSRSGQGARVSTSLLESGLAAMTNVTSDFLVAGIRPRRMGSRHQDQAPYEVVATADGYLALGVATDRHWHAFCAAVGLMELRDHPRFATNAVRTLHREELDRAIVPVLKAKTTAAWLELLPKAGIPCAEVRELPETFDDEQVRDLGIVQEVEHASRGWLRYVRSPIVVDEDVQGATRAAPQLGANTFEVMREYLALDDDELRRLADAGVLTDQAATTLENAASARAGVAPSEEAR